MRKLNGWRRLWVVVSVAMLIPAVIFGVRFSKVGEWPDAKVAALFVAIDVATEYGEKKVLPPDGQTNEEAVDFVENMAKKYPKVSAKKAFDEVEKMKVDWLLGLSRHVLSVSFVYVCSCLILYLIGWSVWWVKSGFDRDHDNEDILS